MSKNIDRKYTFDMNNQPGINNGRIRRSSVIRAIEALGIDPTHVTGDLIISYDKVEATAMLTTTEGHRVLGHPGPEPDDCGSGYLKHTYCVPIVDDEEDMSPSEYYGPNGV